MFSIGAVDDYLQGLDEELLAEETQEALTRINAAAGEGLHALKVIASRSKRGLFYAVQFVFSPHESYEKYFCTRRSRDFYALVAETISVLEVLPVNIFSTALFEFLSGEMIGAKDVVLTIKDVEMQEMNNGKQEETKPVVTFQERDKKWVLNKTSARALADALGPETTAWQGRKVVLHAPVISAFGRTMRAIRVKSVLPAAHTTPSAAPVVEPPAAPIHAGSNNGSASPAELNDALFA